MFTMETNNRDSIAIHHIVVSGAHSSGKTTLLQDYFDAGPDLEALTSLPPYPGIRGTYECTNDYILPIVLAPEAAISYAQFAGTSRVLTDQYSLPDQVAIEIHGISLMNIAGEYAAASAQQVGSPRAMVISDRSILDGYVYSATRLPEVDQEWIDLSDTAEKTGSLLAAPGQPPVALRELWRQLVAETCDAVVMTDHTEVALQDNGTRILDIAFRDQIAASMARYYLQTVGIDRVHEVGGSRPERVTYLNQLVRQVILT